MEDSGMGSMDSFDEATLRDLLTFEPLEAFASSPQPILAPESSSNHKKLKQNAKRAKVRPCKLMKTEGKFVDTSAVFQEIYVENSDLRAKKEAVKEIKERMKCIEDGIKQAKEMLTRFITRQGGKSPTP